MKNSSMLETLNIQSNFQSRIKFNPYQLIPVQRLTDDNNIYRRFYIGDEVGVGKTIEVGLIIKELLEREEITSKDKVLIVSPNIMIYNWEVEMKQKFNLHFKITDAKKENNIENVLINNVGGMYITNYDTFKSKIEISGVKLLVLDEAHYLKNSNSIRYDNIKNLIWDLSENAYVVMLSATPMTKDSWDIYNEINLLFEGKNVQPEFKNRFIEFFKEETDNVYKDYRSRTTKKQAYGREIYRNIQIKPYKFNEELLKCIKNILESVSSSARYELQRALSSSIGYFYYMIENNKENYSEIIDENFNFIRDLINLGKDEKLNALNQVLEDIFKNDSRKTIIVFCYYKETFAYLKKHLKNTYKNIWTINSKSDFKERFETINNCSESNKERKILLLSSVGTEGLNLQFSDTLVNYDMHFSPMVLEQRIGRIDRMTQESNIINIYNFYDESDYRIETKIYENYDDRLYFILFNKLYSIDEHIGIEKDVLPLFNIETIKKIMFNFNRTFQNYYNNYIQNYLIDIENCLKLDYKNNNSEEDLEDSVVEFKNIGEMYIKTKGIIRTNATLIKLIINKYREVKDFEYWFYKQRGEKPQEKLFEYIQNGFSVILCENEEHRRKNSDIILGWIKDNKINIGNEEKKKILEFNIENLTEKNRKYYDFILGFIYLYDLIKTLFKIIETATINCEEIEAENSSGKTIVNEEFINMTVRQVIGLSKIKGINLNSNYSDVVDNFIKKVVHEEIIPKLKKIYKIEDENEIIESINNKEYTLYLNENMKEFLFNQFNDSINIYRNYLLDEISFMIEDRTNFVRNCLLDGYNKNYFKSEVKFYFNPENLKYTSNEYLIENFIPINGYFVKMILGQIN